ncbi:MAG: ecdysteroid 22-kinase family protein [Gammaproteobacteria bacterium]|nr:ecdysteroid 22-kinase family protein [Gammaproteobacteria bacterium]
MEIPTHLDDLTPSWLSAALRVPVRACSLLNAHAGTTGRALIELDYAEASTLPSRLFVKLPPTDEMQRAFVTSSGMGLREVRFYQQLSGEVPLRVPRCYFAAAHDSGDAYIMLLENLTDNGCTFNNISHFYSLAYVRKVLAAFASLHAAYWESPRFSADLDWLQPPLQHDIALPLIESALEQYAGQMPPVFTQMGELYLHKTDAIHALWAQGPQTLIHGDVHDANFFMDNSKVGFLDWALVARGPAMRDVGYFLASALQQGDLRGLRALVEYYRRELASHGVAPPQYDVLWSQLQWHAAYVWVGATVTLAMGDAWLPLNYSLGSLEKLHAAMVYLDSVAAISSAIGR